MYTCCTDVSTIRNEAALYMQSLTNYGLTMGNLQLLEVIIVLHTMYDSKHFKLTISGW